MKVVHIQIGDHELSLLLYGKLVPLVDLGRVKNHDFFSFLTTRNKLVISVVHLLVPTYMKETSWCNLGLARPSTCRELSTSKWLF